MTVAVFPALFGGRAATVMPGREGLERMLAGWLPEQHGGRSVCRTVPLAFAEKMIRHPREVPPHGIDCPG